MVRPPGSSPRVYGALTALRYKRFYPVAVLSCWLATATPGFAWRSRSAARTARSAAARRRRGRGARRGRRGVGARVLLEGVVEGHLGHEARAARDGARRIEARQPEPLGALVV